MEVIRTIGVHEVLVETSEPFGISLAQKTLGPLTSGTPDLEKGDILRLLANGDEYLPLSIQWELLDRCNFSCPFCYIVGHSSKPVVRFSQIRDEVRELVDAGLLFCTLTGGEVTIHPDFAELYSYLKELGVVTEVFTNGYALDDELLSLFVKYPPSAVEVSLYTLDDDRIRTVYGAHSNDAASRVLANVMRMKELGINVVCKTFLNTVTRVDIEAVSGWCDRNGVSYYSSSQMTRAYDGADLSAFELRRAQLIAQTDAPTRKPAALPCGTRNYGAAIDASFSIFPCPAIRLADCTFDLRKLGVRDSIHQMKAFIRRFQDQEIEGSELGESTCMAYAKPTRDAAGRLVSFGI